MISKIAILSVHASPLAPLGSKKAGGMNVYVKELAYELGQRGIQVDIFTRRDASDLQDVDFSLGNNVRLIHVNAGPQQMLNPTDIQPYLSQFAAGVIAFNTRDYGHGYDVVYSHYWLSGWVAHKLNEVWDTPIVHMFHTLGHMKNRIGNSIMNSMPDLRVTTETRIVDWADRMIAATPAEHAQLLWLYRADRRKIVVIPPGVDTKRFQPVPKAEAKALVGIDPACNLILFVGRIEPLKAIDSILEAVSHIQKLRQPLLEKMCVAIIGGDPQNLADSEMQRLLKLARELNLDDVISFLGSKDHNLLPMYYSAASAVIMPSDYESFGMVALEAMASGTPVIASEVGGLAFLVRDQSTGFLVPSRDPMAIAEGITTLLADPEKCELLGQNASAIAEQYAWSNIVDRLLAVFEDVVKNSKPVGAIRRRR